MAFPSSATNGQLATVRGITYQYTSATNSWAKVLVTNANITANTITATSITAATIGNTGAILTGTLGTAAQANITSIGTLSGLAVSGNVTVAGSVFRTNIPLVLDDISNQFNGNTAVFRLRNNNSSVTGIVDAKDLEVIVNGLRLAPYVTELKYPWISPYDSYRGFRVVTTGTTAQKLVIYNAPAIGQQAVVTQLNTSLSKQKRAYPFSATTIALGD